VHMSVLDGLAGRQAVVEAYVETIRFKAGQ
jgi:hypothetical protein